MRDDGKTLADLHYYVPRDEIDYYMQTGKLPKALAANAAYADLSGISVPKRMNDGTFQDAQGDAMMHDDMRDYFARLRAAHAPAPPPAPPVAAVAVLLLLLLVLFVIMD